MAQGAKPKFQRNLRNTRRMLEDLQVGGRKRQNNDDNKPSVVIAIDFGTVNSGIAYSFKKHVNEIKTANYGGYLEEDRVPTVLLLNPNETFNSFGYEAQRKYFELPPTQRRTYYYIKNFKMEIYAQNKINRNMMIRDSSGREVRAMRVFYLAIQKMKELAEFIVKNSTIGYNKDDTLWVITIPAISSDSAKQFMREASINAGIPDHQLKFVLEPEAAALYCKDRLMADTVPVGFKYIIADLGGGTTDICVHETVADDKLIELYRATGEAVGGSSVDKEFEKFMNDLIGDNVWTEFSSEYPSVHVRFMNEFQVKKKHFKSGKDAITLRTDTALIDLIRSRTGKSFHHLIRSSEYADKIIYCPRYDEFVIFREVVEQFFAPSVKNIIEKIRKVLENCRESNIKTILLVGGYSESPYLKERVETEFNDNILRVIFSVNSRLAVLHGAVMMGWNPNHIIQRRSRYTYGFSVMCPFVDGKHPNDLRYIQDGKVWCCKVFVKLIEKGQLLKYKQTFKHKGDNTAISQELKHKERYTAVYRSTEKCPKYCTEEHGCNLIGNITKYPPPEGWPDFWVGESCLIVGETEFTVKDINLTTGKEYRARLDFL